MNHRALLAMMAVAIGINTVAFAEDTERTAPFTAGRDGIRLHCQHRKRAGDILKVLAIEDAAKATRVRDAIVVQYRSLRARDEALDGMFQALSKMRRASRPTGIRSSRCFRSSCTRSFCLLVPPT